MWIAQQALRAILTETADKSPLETGGMLLGYCGQERTDVVITEATGPGPNARHRRYTFTPDGRWQQRRLAEAYEASGRVTTFLGDWHSHPGGQPLPSARDLKTARKVSRHKNARTPYPTTLIVGANDDDFTITTFVFAKDIFHGVLWELFGD